MQDNRPLSMPLRYLEARVSKVFADGGLEAEPVGRQGDGGPRIKVHRYHVPPERLDRERRFHPDERLSLFVYDDHRTRSDPNKAAFGSIIWARPADNPWERAGQLVEGSEVTGTVVRFPDPRHAIVLLDDIRVDAWLDVGAIPDARPYYRSEDMQPLSKFLSLNDRIRARIGKVDHASLTVHISITAAFDAWKDQCKASAGSMAVAPPGRERLLPDELVDHSDDVFLWKIADRPHGQHGREGGAGAPAGMIESADWRHVRLLAIENDKPFANSLKTWIASQGGHVEVRHNFEGLEGLGSKEIDELRLTHVLCDYHLSGDAESQKCLRWLARHIGSRPALRCALMSALPEDAWQAQRRGSEHRSGADAAAFGFFAALPIFEKPILFRELNAWLAHGSAPAWDVAAHQQRSLIWESSRVDANVKERAHAALRAFCDIAGACGAAWLDVPNDEPTELHGDDLQLDVVPMAGEGLRLVPKDWHTRLGNSLLRNVFVTRAMDAQKVQSAGPLREVAPEAAEWVVAWPILSPYAHAASGDACAPPPQGMLLAYFSNDVLARPDPACAPAGSIGRQAALACQHLDDLAALFSLSTHASEQDLFAATGRQLSAVLHEVRSISGDLAPLIGDSQPGAAQAVLPRTRGAVKHLLKVVTQGLFYVQKARPEQLGLAGMLQRMTTDLFWLPVHNSGCSLHVMLPPPDMLVTIPVEPLEHALGNIISNAVDWCQGRNYASVTISVELRRDLGETPLCIRVVDQGLGIGREAERNLFSPRLTEKGRKGYGMGLYISRTLLRGIGGDLVFVRENSYRFFGATFEIRLPLAIGGRRSQQG